MEKAQRGFIGHIVSSVTILTSALWDSKTPDRSLGGGEAGSSLGVTQS